MQLPSLSILPASLVVIETWIIRIFLALAFFAIVPLLLFFVFDFLLYLWRSFTYEVPVVGGRARGKTRPRAPSLKDIPSKRVKAIIDDLTTDHEQIKHDETHGSPTGASTEYTTPAQRRSAT